MQSNINFMIDRFKQVRSLLFSIVPVLPVVVLIITAIQYALYVKLEFFKGSDYLYKVTEFVRQFTDVSLYTFCLLIITSRMYSFLSRVAIVALFLIWMLNTIYLTFNIEADIYFYSFISIIYVTFVIITVRTLINR